MRTPSRLLLAIALGAFAAPASHAAAGEAVDLRQLRRIHVPAEPDGAEADVAALLQRKLRELYKLELEVVRGRTKQAGPGIHVGRAAVRAGLLAQGELEAVKHDGYVLKGAADRVALAGYARQGTLYAAWALLRRLGLRVYPWYHGADDGAAEVFRPVRGGVLQPFAQADKPFVEHRDLRDHLDHGRWGVTLRRYALGDPSQAANQGLFGRKRKPGYTKYKLKRSEWTGWFHTAAYLLPRDLYYETHPEYFAIHRGTRIRPSRYARSQICTTHPDVLRISTERALEWMGLQRDRRIFCIAPADTALCQCPRCLTADPLPGHTTDRMLAWVNHLAAAARRRHPDNVILTGAYIETVKPPVRVEPAPNVVVMYCPWFWNSRATSEVSFDSPLNLTAMKELMGWTMRFPAQVGLYDYPTDCARGTAERVKLCARHGVRFIYFNGPQGSRLHWLVSQLLWDPFQDIEGLEAEFAAASYGPAAKPIGDYYRLRRATIERHGAHSRTVFRPGRGMPAAIGPAFLKEARALFRQAAGRADKADAETQTRILAEVASELRSLLYTTHPTQGDPILGRDRGAFMADVTLYVQCYQRCMANCKRLRLLYLARRIRESFQKTMTGLGLPTKDIPEEPPPPPGDDTFALINSLVESALPQPTEIELVAGKVLCLSFAGADEASKWLSDGSQPERVSPARTATVSLPGGEQARGVQIDAPLSTLPVIRKGNLSIHAGRFYAERVFDPPLTVRGCYTLDLHVHASRDVPVTLYVDSLHSDVDLHAGEQIVRIDFRNFGASDRFDWRKWSKVERLAIDIWPQDNGYPFPTTRDARITLLGVVVGDHEHGADLLPHRGKAVWLSQFRPNVSRGVAVPRDRWDELMQRQHYKHVGLDYGSKFLHEQFRTFTEHRAVSPIYAIVTSEEPEALELEAARELQERLAQATGVKLPINPPGVKAGPSLGNVVLLGQAARLAQRVEDIELKYVGRQGFVINAHHGRIAIAGQDASGTAYGVARYLEDHGARFYTPDAARPPTLARGFLHELYLPDRPFFALRPIAGGWQLKTPRPARVGLPHGSNAAEVAELAEGIKDAARRGEETVPPRLLAAAHRSALSRYVAAKLMWDPMADATRMIREFPSRRGR